MRFHTQRDGGLTLLEVVVASAILGVVAVAFYQSYTSVFRVIAASRAKLAASFLATEQFEIMRNMPYAEVGVIDSIPNGVIPYTQTLVRDGMVFTVITIIRNIDDPFDGVIGGVPNDTSPADYKLAQVTIECETCRDFAPILFATRVSPKNLETASTNGALFIRVFDLEGDPVQGANVRVENNTAVPAIVINDVTDQNGMLQLVDVPPAVATYEITVSKSGYTSERTYPFGAPENPNPEKPHATVALQQVTQISFVIDRVSSLTIQSVTAACDPVGSVDFILSGAKLIGLSPDVLKYSSPHTTDPSGDKVITDLDSDVYSISLADPLYDLLGWLPFPASVAADTSLDLRFVVADKDSNALLVTVRDSSTQQPILEAEVSVSGVGTLITGDGFLSQTDWSGGDGQTLFNDETMYASDDGGLETDAVAGTVLLRDSTGTYVSSGELTSSVFDTVSGDVYHKIAWRPEEQPESAGADAIRFQIATGNDAATTTWNYLGPDGTGATHYALGDQDIHPVHNGDRYFRYRMFLHTDDTSVSPSVSHVSLSSDCIPPGQVLFQGLSNGTYTVAVSKDGYQSYDSGPVSISSPFVFHEAVLFP